MSRPNILFIMADDHAAKAISCYGAGMNKTPNLDRIAEHGQRFNHCYVTNSICTPSRATILTGTHNHTNLVHTLVSKINKSLPNVAKQLKGWGGYKTAMVGKWHLGEGKEHEPEGFDYWEVLPGQGDYFDPEFITPKGRHTEWGYATDIITDKALDFIDKSGKEPWFVMCHHKAPHRQWECDPKHAHLYQEDIALPETFDDDYKNRAKAAAAAKMRVEVDLTYKDLGLATPEGGREVGDKNFGAPGRKIPSDPKKLRGPLIDLNTGEQFTFKTKEELKRWKYQRYMKRYMRTIQSIDDNVGRMLDYLDQKGMAENTMVIYTSDQGFFLGEHGWFDKRFIYEESFQMPFLIRGPGIKPGINNDIISNVDFAATWLEFAGLKIPSYMQGKSFLPSLLGKADPQSEWECAYHRYWMHREKIHNSYAHYGIRSKRYKLIFWYNDGLNLPATLNRTDEEQEWELFDCDKDPLEIFNLWYDPSYNEIKEKMVRVLEAKMEDIGDVPQHPVGLGVSRLMEIYTEPKGIAERAEEHNM